MRKSNDGLGLGQHSEGNDIVDDWYGNIEENVREEVRVLRNAGINTTSSCGHDMTIECDTLDLTAEFQTIYNILTGLGYQQYQIQACWDIEPNGCSSRHLAIQLPHN